MRKILPIFLILLFLFNAFKSLALSQFNFPKGSAGTEVNATVGEFYLNISGFISPYASVVMTSNGAFIRATVADVDGNFYISQVLIKRGFSNFCLEAVDFKRIGNSNTCFSISPAKSSITMRNIFLPPTLGLSKTEIREGEETLAFGYTMPQALVTLSLSNGKLLTTTADASGFYKFSIKKLKAGRYQLYTTAEFKNKQSLKPAKKLEVRSLSLWEQFIAFIKRAWKTMVRFFKSISFDILWAAIPIFILIIILILKLWPEKFTFFYNNKLMVLLPKPKRKHLHHFWFVGY